MFSIIFSIQACETNSSASEDQYVSTTKKHRNAVAVTDTSVFAIIEIPAGTTEYFDLDSESGKIKSTNETLEFLPFPGNLGFIPKTKLDGRPIDVIVLSKKISSGEEVNTKPIGGMRIKMDNNERFILIAVPYEEKMKTIKAESFQDFFTIYDPVKFILEQWFQNYDGKGKKKIINWMDEVSAFRHVKNNQVD
ncbi:MAG: inorganic diphosphatase [Bacteroidota bacterium]